MRMEQLRCLVDIAQTKSISTTAQNLYMSHQAVSQRVKQLENDLGVELLIRTNTGVRITEVGERVVSYAKQILSAESAIEQLCEAQKLSGGNQDVLIRIASSSPVLSLILSDIFVVFDPLPYKITLKITQLPDVDAVLKGLLCQNYDIGFVTYQEEALEQKMETLSNQLQMELLWSDELVAVTKQKLCKNSQDVFPMELCRAHLKTSYNIIPTEEHRAYADEMLISQSSDADLHRRLIDRKNVVTMMPGLSYQYAFRGKKYTGLPMEQSDITFSHAAIYDIKIDYRVTDLIAMVRREIQVKK